MVEAKITIYSVVTELIEFKQPLNFAVIYDYFILVCFRRVVTPLVDRNKTVFEILPKYMALESLVLQLKLMVLMMVFTEICARGKCPCVL